MEIKDIMAGRFFNSLQVDYTFGVPLNASASGLAMDIGLIRTLVRTLDGTKDKQLQFMHTSGMNSSALEHSVPEQLFSTPENPAQGISAVKALQISNDQGIPVYTINQYNIAAILPQLQLDSNTIIDIQNAVNAGKEVTVSETSITFNGWTGCGYIVIDPNTGAGAYMISGGTNGAILVLCALLPGCLLAATFLFMAVLGSALFYLYLLLSIVLLLVVLIASFLFTYGPLIVSYLTLVSACGEEAAREYLKCLLWMVGIDISIQSISALIKMIPSIIAKSLSKYIHHIGLVVAAGEFVLCTKNLVLTCNKNP